MEGYGRSLSTSSPESKSPAAACPASVNCSPVEVAKIVIQLGVFVGLSRHRRSAFYESDTLINVYFVFPCHNMAHYFQHNFQMTSKNDHFYISPLL